MSSFSPDSPMHHGCSPIPLVPPNEQMASLTVDDNKTSNRPTSPDSRFTIQMSNFSSDSSKLHGCSPVPAAPPTEQATSLAVEDKSSNSNNSPDSSDATSPSFFQLLETVSPHVQSVLLDKCNVLELSSLAVVSSSLRKGALATMAKRSLIVRFDMNNDKDEESGEFVFRNETMHINDCSDPSRNVIIEIGKEYPCFSWRKIQKLLYFCGHAAVTRIVYDIVSFNTPESIEMSADHCTRTEWSLEEFFVDEFVSFTYYCFDLLKFVSPRNVTLILFNEELRNDDVIVHARLHSVLHSRGVLSADSVFINFINQPIDYIAITDSLMLLLAASSITFNTSDVDSRLADPTCIRWSPVGVSLFIEQWLRGSRVIKHVQSCLPMENTEDVIEFGKQLVDCLGKLEQPPKIDFSTSLADDFKSHLQNLDGGPIYVFSSPAASTIRLTATDGRQLMIMVTKGWDINNNLPTIAGDLIDIYLSS